MLVAYGVVTTFVTWLFPLIVLLIEAMVQPPDRTDLALIGVCAAVVGVSAVFWLIVLRSERVATVVAGWLHRITVRLARRIPPLADHDPAEGC